MRNTVKYLGYWSANNGASYGSEYEFSNKATARKVMRDIASGNTFSGNTGLWWIDDTGGESVSKGSVHIKR